MELYCSYCAQFIGSKEPLDDHRRTHGICPACQAHFDNQGDGQTLDDYLDTLPQSVLVVDAQGRVAAANRAALEMLNQPVERVHGLLGGEAMGCVWSRLPEGCGRTVHCPACTIRKVVEETAATGIAQISRLVRMTMDDGFADMQISTSFRNNLVRIVIEKIQFHAASHCDGKQPKELD